MISFVCNPESSFLSNNIFHSNSYGLPGSLDPVPEFDPFGYAANNDYDVAVEYLSTGIVEDENEENKVEKSTEQDQKLKEIVSYIYQFVSKHRQNESQKVNK